jgi:hypothetical protein
MTDKSLSELHQWQQHALLAQGLKNLGNKLTGHLICHGTLNFRSTYCIFILVSISPFSIYFVIKQFPHHHQNQFSVIQKYMEGTVSTFIPASMKTTKDKRGRPGGRGSVV